jgi:putative FmdB family regulatory protein
VPIYEYQCKVCQHRFDALQKMGEDGTELKCPKCGEGNPNKLFSAFSSSTPSGESASSCSNKGFS